MPDFSADATPTTGAAWVQQHSAAIAQTVSPAYFQNKRWFGSKGRRMQTVQQIDSAFFAEDPAPTVLLLLRVDYDDDTVEFYHVPLCVQPKAHVPEAILTRPDTMVATIDSPNGPLVIYDAFQDENFRRNLYRAMFDNLVLPTADGNFVFHAIEGQLVQPAATTARLVSTEQSNTSIIFDHSRILKCFRKLAAGLNPDFEIPFFLTQHTAFTDIPKVSGYITYEQHSGAPVSMGVMAEFVDNDGDGYTYALQQLRDYYERIQDTPGDDAARQAAAPFAADMRRLGQITGELHNALASDAAIHDAAFAPERITHTDIQLWKVAMVQSIEASLKTLDNQRQRFPERLQPQLDTILAHRQDYLDRVECLNVLEEAEVMKIRYHGDYHLGQVLKTGDSFVILDFEGEPARSLAQRRAKNCAAKDVVGMLRSFNYAAYSVLFEEIERQGEEADSKLLETQASLWEHEAREAFMAGYTSAIEKNTGAQFLPRPEEGLADVLTAFEMEKAFYELNYEINNRPGWIAIPIKGLQRIVEP